jgi:Arsenical resistance operon protein ArsD
MKTLNIYDPPMCCSTGVCGPQVDNTLVRFAADLKWLADQRVEVRRYNLAQEPGAFVENEMVRTFLQEKGDTALPLIISEGKTIAAGRYPTRDELCQALGLVNTTLPKLTLTGPSGGCCGGGKC